MSYRNLLLLTLSILAFYLSREVAGRPCGACQCFFRTGFVSCATGKADEIYGTLRMEDMAWAKSLDLRNIDGVVDTHFYVVSRFPDLHDVDLRGIFYDYFQNCLKNG